MNQIMRKLLFVVIAFILVIPSLGAKNLSTQLKQLATTAKFEIRGLDRVGAVPTIKSSGGTLQQIRVLLEKFDYVIVHGTKQNIQRLIILGPKQNHKSIEQTTENKLPSVGNVEQKVEYQNVSKQVGEITLTTQRDGLHHLINATLFGVGKRYTKQELLIDTGASITVIPDNQANALGFDLNQLPTRSLQTMKGELQVKVATLPKFELGNLQIPNLDVAFAASNNLNSRGLLGMNLLSRYLFILDDERNELTLIPDPH
jgi:clan AA aspartic protease (TIGR02281 family)